MRYKPHAGGESGAAAVEFALVLPFLMVIVFGIVDFGRYYHAQVTLTHGAREGVRHLALNGSLADLNVTPDAQGRTRLHPLHELSLVPGVADDQPVTVTAARLRECSDSVTDARLALQKQFQFLTPLPALVEALSDDATVEFATGFTIRGEAVMRCGG